MRNGMPVLRSEAFNEAFDDFDDAFVKALASSNPLVFDLHEKVMGSLTKLTENEAIAELINATWQFLIHATGKEIIRSPAVSHIAEVPKVDVQLIRDAVLRHRQRALSAINSLEFTRGSRAPLQQNPSKAPQPSGQRGHEPQALPTPPQP